MSRYRRSRTQRLDPFIDGIARIFDFTGSLRTPARKSYSYNPRSRSGRILQRDWEAVGNAFRAVLGNWEEFEPRESEAPTKRPAKDSDKRKDTGSG